MSIILKGTPAPTWLHLAAITLESYRCKSSIISVCLHLNSQVMCSKCLGVHVSIDHWKATCFFSFVCFNSEVVMPMQFIYAYHNRLKTVMRFWEVVTILYVVACADNVKCLPPPHAKEIIETNDTRTRMKKQAVSFPPRFKLMKCYIFLQSIDCPWTKYCFYP